MWCAVYHFRFSFLCWLKRQSESIINTQHSCSFIHSTYNRSVWKYAICIKDPNFRKHYILYWECSYSQYNNNNCEWVRVDIQIWMDIFSIIWYEDWRQIFGDGKTWYLYLISFQCKMTFYCFFPDIFIRKNCLFDSLKVFAWIKAATFKTL